MGYNSNKIMRRNIFVEAIIAAMFCACGIPNTPTISGGGTTNVSIYFTYKVEKPFTLAFTNSSSGANSYKWDFGDGNYATTYNATHTYASEGTYIVTLTGTANGVKYDYSKKITVKKPSIYISGYKLYSIPVENRYYKVVCKDDDWFGTDWGFTTTYTPLLDNTDMPYVRKFNTPLLMDKLDGDNYYTFYVYYNTSTSNANGDQQCMKQQLQKTEIYKYKDEHILKSNNGETKIGILMEYR